MTKDASSADFVDGILLDRELGHVIVGHSVSAPSGTPLATFGGAWDEWFHTYFEKEPQNDRTSLFEMILPVKDYLFRYECGAFWTGRYGDEYFGVPFNRTTR